MDVLCILMFVLLYITHDTLADWDETCPRNCKCTYASNRKLADCPNAGFSTIPTTLSTEVQELNLISNYVRYLDKDAFKKEGLINLQKLYLGNNNIGSIHMDAFMGLSIMIELDLSSNSIQKLHPITFTGMEKLRVLDLSNNLLSGLNGVQFPPLHHLRKLIFTSNRITYIDNYAFVNLPLLNSLKLSENKLKHMEPKLFTNNTGLKELELHDNLWECDCHLKNLVRWVKAKYFLQTHISCHSPQSLSGKKWEDLSEDELACRPEVIVPQLLIPATLGQNASLSCHAKGEPLPKIKWVLHGRVLTNLSVIKFSEPQQRFVVRQSVYVGENIISGDNIIGGEINNGDNIIGDEIINGDEIRSYLTIIHVIEDDFTYYTCVADNIAGLVEQNISLIPTALVSTGAITPNNELDLFIIISIVVVCIVFIIVIIIIIICCCCIKYRKPKPKPITKVNGVTIKDSEENNVKNVIVVNPVDKPPRQYKQIPQNDNMELTLLNTDNTNPGLLNTDPGGVLNTDNIDPGTLHNTDNIDTGTHLSYDNVDYPEPGQSPQHTHLSTLQEEHNELLCQDTSLPPLDNTTSYSVVDYMSQYPDLIMTKPTAVSPTQLSYHTRPTAVSPTQLSYHTRPTAVSPTQLSYQSVVVPQYTIDDQQHYYYTQKLSGYTPYHVTYNIPNNYTTTTSGYVTLPRKHQSPSTWTGHVESTSSWIDQPSTSISPPPPPPPCEDDGSYDTFGPRTTVDGTLRTDLIHPGLCTAEPFSPCIPQSPTGSPTTYYSTLASSTTPYFNDNYNQNTIMDGSTNVNHNIPSKTSAKRLSATSQIPNASTLISAYRSILNGASTSNPESNELIPESTYIKIDKNIDTGSSFSGVVGASKKVVAKPAAKLTKRVPVSASSDVQKKSSVVAENGRVFQDQETDGTDV